MEQERYNNMEKDSFWFSQGYDDGYYYGKQTGYKEGFEEGRRAALKEVLDLLKEKEANDS